MCSGVILAGGLCSRFQGRNKALVPVAGKTILDRVHELFRELFEEIILVTNEPLAHLDRDISIVTDLFDYRSSLTGIHAGLFAASLPFAFVAACDTPFLRRKLVETVIASGESRDDVIIPETSAGLEPMCAVYSKRCLHLMEEKIAAEKVKIQRLFEQFRVKKVPEHVLLETDPELDSFFNVNRPEDLIQAERIAVRYDKEL